MAALLPSRTLSVAVARPPPAVYAFASDPLNLPAWAPGFARAVRREGDAWIAETAEGPARFAFAARNGLGVLDHVVTLPDGARVEVPMRVVPNGDGSEVLLTIFRLPGMDDARFERDAATVASDLRTLKSILEGVSPDPQTL